MREPAKGRAKTSVAAEIAQRMGRSLRSLQRDASQAGTTLRQVIARDTTPDFVLKEELFGHAKVTLRPVAGCPLELFSPVEVLGGGLAVLVVGVVLVSVAGAIRHREQGVEQPATNRPKAPFLFGLLICVLAGVFCPMAYRPVNQRILHIC